MMNGESPTVELLGVSGWSARCYTLKVYTKLITNTLLELYQRGHHSQGS
jgi:hypothetical protein